MLCMPVKINRLTLRYSSYVPMWLENNSSYQSHINYQCTDDKIGFRFCNNPKSTQYMCGRRKEALEYVEQIRQKCCTLAYKKV